MQIECRTTSLLDCYAEMQLILCKDNAKIRLSEKERNELFISYFEREDFIQIECRTTSLLDCYAEIQLILYKDKKKNK